MVSNDALGYALVKAEAAAGGAEGQPLQGYRSQRQLSPRSVGRPLPLPQPLAVGSNRPPRLAIFTHSKFKRAIFRRTNSDRLDELLGAAKGASNRREEIDE